MSIFEECVADSALFDVDRLEDISSLMSIFEEFVADSAIFDVDRIKDFSP